MKCSGSKTAINFRSSTQKTSTEKFLRCLFVERKNPSHLFPIAEAWTAYSLRTTLQALLIISVDVLDEIVPDVPPFLLNKR